MLSFIIKRRNPERHSQTQGADAVAQLKKCKILTLQEFKILLSGYLYDVCIPDLVTIIAIIKAGS